jgi:NAD+ synthase
VQGKSTDVGGLEKSTTSTTMIPKQMTPKQRIKHISKWIRDYARKAGVDTLVVGISGGIDSSVVSALCAETGLKTIVVQMPIRQNRKLDNLSSAQAGWLLEQFPNNVTHMSMDLTTVFSAFEKKVQPFCGPEQEPNEREQLAFANSRARLRMMTLYQIAQSHGGIVVGTGNRVEDFGVGFFTKYGDGGVDISPIGDCMKTDVWAMGRELGLLDAIIDAPPTDGLWADDRNDEDQLGMTYPDLERMMSIDFLKRAQVLTKLSADDRKKLKRYQELRAQNMHKMTPVPVCKFDQKIT